MIDAIVPRVGVGVLVVDEDRVLLTLRRRAPEAGRWSILGGRVEAFETLESCARREVREEAGIDIAIECLLCVTDHILSGENVHWVSPAYLARLVGGVAENREPEKAAEVAWFPLGALPELMTMTAHRAIAAYLNHSDRSVVAGSTAAARLAGTQQATTATVPSKVITPP